MINLSHVRFSYDGQTPVLRDVNLSVEDGEFLCILGGNGSGKSTLARHINALLIPDEGEVVVDGINTRETERVYDIRANVGMVFQNPDDQIVASLIEQDVAFGPENLGLPSEVIRERVTKALAQVGLQGFELRETRLLSGGQKQRVALAGALAMQPRVLVLDEASAMLDPRGRWGLVKLCSELNAAGITIIMITHFMDEAAHASRVCVLDEGRITMSGSPIEVFSETEKLMRLGLDVPFAAKIRTGLAARGYHIPPVVTNDALVEYFREQVFSESAASEASAGVSSSSGMNADSDASAASLLPETFAATASSAASPMSVDSNPSSTPKAALIRFDHASYSYEPPRAARGKKSAPAPDTPPSWGGDPKSPWAFRDISFEVYPGEFFGIAGHTGSGKSTLIQHMNGLYVAQSGQVLVNGKDLADKHARNEVKRHIGLVFQYPESQLFAPTVREDISFGPQNLGLSAAEVESRTIRALHDVGLPDEVLDMSPFELSGGQQRRVAFAGVLAMEPETLVLDEPVAGLDPHARAEFFELILSLKELRQMTVIMVSHDMDDLARLCDRILVLNRGELFALGTPAEVFTQTTLIKSVGLDVPNAQDIALKLAADSPRIHAFIEHEGLMNEENLVQILADEMGSAQ